MAEHWVLGGDAPCEGVHILFLGVHLKESYSLLVLIESSLYDKFLDTHEYPMPWVFS